MKVDFSSSDLRLISHVLQLVETQLIESFSLSSLKSEKISKDQIDLQKYLKDLSDRCFLYYTKALFKEDPRA